MAEPDPDIVHGASCTATLDEAAQTLTFEHRGWGASYEQKARSSLVVPLGAIGPAKGAARAVVDGFFNAR